MARIADKKRLLKAKKKCIGYPPTKPGDPLKDILFANDEPAAIVKQGGKRYLIVGDLHIGRELKLAARGIRVYGTSDLMAERIISLLKRYKARRLVLLGDVKDSIIRPDSVEMRIIHSFFRRLSDYEIILVQGNHDAGLGEIAKVLKVKEFRIGKVGLIHGNSIPSEEVMKSDYIIAGHDHPAVMAYQNGGGHLEKAWVTMKIKPAMASKMYEKPNRKTRLILMPAFNDLITGTDVNERKMLNPLVKRGIFNSRTAKIYDVKGRLSGLGL